MSFLKIRAIVNGKEIYPLLNSKPVLIPIQQNNPRLVITDGYHITKSMKINYQEVDTCCFFEIKCAISDRQLILGFIVLAAFYLSGYLTGILILKILSFLPMIYLLAFYYMSRKDFIRMVPVSK
ncbi:MAG: hypothetical protein KA968_02190 [Chitinophagaceae bacterium]|nr:hypothetical protein [Chitinophagaceae bacterium]MBP6478447.1 hypothetical protein [Chitinophagaceae bacterium]MBP7109062.1 hypothetical protein [Chitinophagaceae bacterium]MBP7314004.1 hypothetical protein [Chitinophagaceae bacterium]HQX95847.1 hypothetical protein [Chitinophagaceae bacterium]